MSIKPQKAMRPVVDSLSIISDKHLYELPLKKWQSRFILRPEYTSKAIWSILPILKTLFASQPNPANYWVD